MTTGAITSSELGRQLMKVWKLPNLITSIDIKLSIDQKVPLVTVSYLMTNEEAKDFLEIVKEYNLVENEPKTGTTEV